MAFSRSPEWDAALAVLDEWWASACYLCDDVELANVDGGPNFDDENFTLQTYELIEKFGATGSNIDPSPIHELFGRLLWFYKTEHFLAVPASLDELRVVRQKAYWFVNKCRKFGILPEATSAAEEPAAPPATRSTAKASAQDILRWEFAKPLREKETPVTWRMICEQWRKLTGEDCSEQAFRKSWHRARNSKPM